jgi:isopentenyldiphosphate isomerase
METNETVEMVDVVDESNNVIGEAPRKGIHKTGKLHRAAHIFMFDSAGRLWIERRGQTADTNPGYYDSSAAGHVRKGETYEQGAQREALEELGIEGLELKPVYDLPASPSTGNEFVRLFITHSDKKPKLHEDAASQKRYTIEEIDEKITHGEKFVPTFLKLFEWYKLANH